MAVDFVASAATQAVQFVPNTASFPADCQEQTLNTFKAYFCTAVMTGLAPNTTHTYKVGADATGWSQPFPFVSEPAKAMTFAIYADFGFRSVVRSF